MKARERDYQERYPALLEALGDRPWAMKLWVALARASSWFYVLPLLGLLCFLEPTPRCAAVRWLLCVSAAILVVTYMGTDAVIQFRNPFDPVFVLSGVAGLATLRRLFPAARRG